MKKAAIAVNGRWVEVQFDLLPEVAWWTAQLGKSEVKVTVDSSSGEPRIASIELRGRDITRTDRERLADLDTEQCINDVIARYGKRRPDPDGNALLMAEERGRLSDSPELYVDDPDVTRSVRTRRRRQRILLAEVAEIFNESRSLSEGYEAVQKHLGQAGRGDSLRSAQHYVTLARKAGLTWDAEP